MSKILNEFKKVSKQEWANKIVSDLKGKDPSKLNHINIIEDIEYSSFYHEEDKKPSELPGNFPFTRGMNLPDNSFNNGAYVLDKFNHKIVIGFEKYWPTITLQENLMRL